MVDLPRSENDFDLRFQAPEDVRCSVAVLPKVLGIDVS
jgi:hypothetical protein